MFCTFLMISIPVYMRLIFFERDLVSVHESQPYRSIDSINALNTLILVSFLIGENHTFDNALRAPHAFPILLSTSWALFMYHPRYRKSSTFSISEPSRACTLLSEVALSVMIFVLATIKKRPMDCAALSTLCTRSSASLMVFSISAMSCAYANSANTSSGCLRLRLFFKVNPSDGPMRVVKVYWQKEIEPRGLLEGRQYR